MKKIHNGKDRVDVLDNESNQKKKKIMIRIAKFKLDYLTPKKKRKENYT